MVRRRAKGKRPSRTNETLQEWAARYPEKPVTRRELLVIMSQILGPPIEEQEPREIEA